MIMDSSEAPLNVIHVLNDIRDVGNGINNSTVDLAVQQQADGHSVWVMSKGGGHQELLESRKVKLLQRRTDNGLRGILVDSLKLRRFIRSGQASVRAVLHAHTLAAVVIAVLARRRHDLVVATAHLERKRGISLMLLADRVVVLSNSALSNLPRRFYRISTVITQAVLGTNRSRRSLSGTPVQQIRQRHDEILLITVCGLYPHKGIYTLLSAFEKLAGEDERYRLAYVGDGPERKALADRVRRHKLDGKVHLLGFRQNVLDYLEQADVFLLLSSSEPAGLVLAEAREVGTPIIACQVDGIPSMVDDGRAAILIPPNDATAAVDAIRSLVSDYARRDRI